MIPLEGLARAAGGLSRWAGLGLAALLGGVAALALPPFNIAVLLLVAFPGLVWLLDGASGKGRALGLGWFFGLGHFVVALHWIAAAFLVDAARFAYLIPVAVLGLAGLMAAFPALAALAAWRFGRPGWRRALMLALAWTALEWLRGQFLTGFPWALIGYAWSWSAPMSQAFALAGVLGLGFLTVLAAALAGSLHRRHHALGLAAVFASLAALYLGGVVRLSGATEAVVEGVGLRIIQPNIAQAEKWRPEKRQANFQRLLELSGPPVGFTHLIWPETATPFFLGADPQGRLAAARVVPEGGLLITGSPRRNGPGEPGLRLWNSVHALAPDGTVRATYDKHHLVPFGEFLPLRPVLEALGLAMLAAGKVDYSPGPGPSVWHLDGLPPVQPLVCYEVIFADEIAAERPAWLLNLTNDAWFGESIGPEQHFQIARARAIEQGLPLVRAANTGISGVIDAHGRVRARLELSTSGRIDSPLPRALATPPPYARFGDALLLLLLPLLIFASPRRRQARPPLKP